MLTRRRERFSYSFQGDRSPKDIKAKGFDLPDRQANIISNPANSTQYFRAGLLAITIAAFLLCDAPQAYAAIGIGANASANSGRNAVLSLTLTNFTVSGSNTLLIVGVSIRQTTTNQSVSSVRYGTAGNFTRVGTFTNAPIQVELWQLVAPPAGTANIVVTLSATARFVAGAQLFTGVDQTTPLGPYATNSGTSTAASVTVPAATGEYVIDILGNQNTATATAINGGTRRWTNITTSPTGNANTRGSCSTKAGASSVKMDWTLSASRVWAIMAVPVVPFIVVDEFGYRKQITIDRTKVGVPGTTATTLSNYPMLLNIVDPDLRTIPDGYVQNANGYDIMFRGVNDAVCGGPGTNPCVLSYQVEKYVAATGTLVAWIRLPSVNTNAAASDTSFYIYFGNSAITESMQDVTGVWDSNFQAVWHLSDNAASTTVAESTAVTTISDGVAAANTSTKTTGGQIAEALTFNGTSDYIYQSASTAITNPQGYTLSAWVKTATASGRKIIGFESVQTGTTSTSYDRMMWIGTDGYAYAGCYTTTHIAAYSNAAVTDDNWHFITAQLDDADDHIHVFVDGVAQTVYGTVGGACETTNGYWRMGSYKLVNWQGGGTDGYFTGSVDEARISDTIRSADWIMTDYNSQGSPGTFYSSGDLEGSPITLIKLISFTATNYSGLVQLRWKTGYEIDNLGFRLYREDAGGLARITPSMVAGSALLAREHVALTSGRTYTWQDFVGHFTTPLRYWLEDVDTKGKSTWHGPIMAESGDGDLPHQVQSVMLSYLGKGASHIQSNGSNWNYWHNSALQAQPPILSVMKPASSGETYETETLSSGPDPASEAAVKIQIKQEGWYRLAQPQLMQAGLSPLADPKKLQLFVDGIEQPIAVYTCGGLVRTSVGQNSPRPGRGANPIGRRDCEKNFGENDWIEFYAIGLDSTWSDTRAYFLLEGAHAGKRIPISQASGAHRGPSSLLTTLEFKPKTIYVPELRNGDADNFFGSVVSIDGDEETLPLTHFDLSSSAAGRLEVKLQGVTEEMLHSVQVEVNGTVLGSLSFEGQSEGMESFTLPPGLLRPGDNSIRLRALNGEDDFSLIEYLRVSYWRTPDADNDLLPISVAGNQTISIGGFTTPAIRIVDITDPAHLKEMTGTIAPYDGWYSITIAIKGSGVHNLLAFANAAIQEPAAVKPNSRSTWSQETEGFSVVIISHVDFIPSLRSLRVQLIAEGYSVALIDVEDLYDEFSLGQKSPYAIKDFLAGASSNWRKKPSFLILVGDASFDPRNLLGLGDFDYMPTKFIDTQVLETASDDWFADFNDDGIPEMAVGRISVRTPAEAAAQVAKIIAYKQAASAGSSGAWADKVVLVADRNDGFDFEAASNLLSDQVPNGLSVSKIYRGQMSDTSARNQILQTLNAGALVVNYLGHGSVELWRGNVLTSEDPAGLTNGAKLPLLISMDCLNGYFSDIYTESLAEALMKAPNGGAVGVWTASGLTDPLVQVVMNREFAVQLLQYSQTVGEAVIKAKAAANDPDVRKTWIFFGDPTIRLPN